MNFKKYTFAFLCAVAGMPVLHAQTPFLTTVRNYTYVGKPGTNADANPISLYTSTTTPPTTFGAGTPISFTNGAAQSLNGTGISSVDGFMYGLDYLFAGPNSTNANVYRIGSDAVASQVGIIPGPTSANAGRPIQFSFVNTASGMIDAAGDYWFAAYTFTDAVPPYTANKVDVFIGKVSGLAALTPGTTVLAPSYYKIDVSDPVLQTGYTNFMTSAVAFMAAGQSYTNANGGWQDMDLRPSDGKFYSYIAFPSAPTTGSPTPEPPLNSYLVRIDPVNAGGYWGKATLINTTPNTNPNYEEDGAYFDAAGNYFVLFTNGDQTQVDLNTGAIGALVSSGLPLSNGEMRGDLATNSPVTPLPMGIVSFRAARLSDAVLLNWTINRDGANVASVTVERSADAKNFSELITLKEVEDHAGYTDAKPIADAYYRLRFNIANGGTLYSKVLHVMADGESAAVNVSVYPNPVNDHITVETATKNIQVSLANAAGTIVASDLYNNEYQGAIDVRLPALTAGSYVLTVRDAVSGNILLSKMISKL